MVVDFATLTSIMHPVLHKFDHQDLNAFIQVPTAERIGQWILTQLQDTVRTEYPDSEWGIVQVAVSETANTWVEITI
jgi:6-pyruvoyl-tetrahydropterin synthase